jgi:uncharacterized membrane protein
VAGLAWQRVSASFDPAQRAGVLSAAASVGPSLYPGLRPRSTQDQVIATGLIASLNYGLEAMSASLMRGLAVRIAGGRRPESALARTGVMLASSGLMAGAGIALQRVFSQQHAEPMRRAALRTLGWRVTRGAAITATAGSVLGALEALEQRPGARFPWTALPIMAPIGGAAAALEVERVRRRAESVDIEDAESNGQSGRTVAIGLGVAVGLTVFGAAENHLAERLARGVRRAAPGVELLAAPIGHAVVLGAISAAGMAGLEYVMRAAENGGNAVEAAYHDRPMLASVSGGPDSLVSFDDIGREGRRFVNMALTRAEIDSVVGGAVAEPIRVFVGLASAEDTDARAYLAFRELERTGAFDRPVLCFASPTGTGYVNPQAIETLEYLTRGNCATVAIQYSLRPSPLSLNRVDLAVQQNRALLHLISGRLAAMDPNARPRLVLFGESLGANSMQDVFKSQGSPGMVQAGADAGLFLGTPALTNWVQQWRAYPDRYDPERLVAEVANEAEWAALPAEVRSSVRFVLLSNHDDPIVKFSPDLLVQAPDWLGPVGSRPPGVPQGVSWRPFNTFVLTAIDAKNGMDPVPGRFVASGHDYRLSLARMTQQAYRLEATEEELAAVEKALREREEQWASRRIVTQQLAMARDAIQQQVRAWNPNLDVSGVLDSAGTGPGVP